MPKEQSNTLESQTPPLLDTRTSSPSSDDATIGKSPSIPLAPTPLQHTASSVEAPAEVIAVLGPEATSFPEQSSPNEGNPGESEEDLRRAVAGLVVAYRVMRKTVAHIHPVRVRRLVGDLLTAADANDLARLGQICDLLSEEEMGAVLLGRLMLVLPDTACGKRFGKSYKNHCKAGLSVTPRWVQGRVAKVGAALARAAKKAPKTA